MKIKNIEGYIVNEICTLRDAMMLIEENEHRSLIVVDEAFRVVGVISDGDIRKAILQERLLETLVKDVMNIHFFSLKASTSEEEAKTLFTKERIFIIPILDDNGKLVSIETAY